MNETRDTTRLENELGARAGGEAHALFTTSMQPTGCLMTRRDVAQTLLYCNITAILI